MDFTSTPEQDDARELAAAVFAKHCTPARLREIDLRTDGRYDATLWSALGEAGLLGLALPESAGGSGLSLLEACSVLVEGGRTVAPIPLVAHTVASLTLAHADGRHPLLAAAAEGSALLSVAVAEELDALALSPATTSHRNGDHWLLDGVKTLVPAATRASALLVLASDGDETTVFLVRTEDASVEPQRLSDGAITGLLTCRSAKAARLGGADLADFLVQHLKVATAAWQLGQLEGALALTAAYAKTREQFGRPIGTFQAVSQRLADGYIDNLGARLTLWQAAWRLAEGLPAAREADIAQLWAADAGHAVAHTTVHVHGGVGIDLDGEAHRYFTALKDTELSLGGAGRSARAVGAELAAAD